MSPYELGTGSNVLGGGGPRLPMGGNTDCGQRDSGYLAVSPSAWVAGLIKPVQSPDAVLETRLWANHGVRVYANQRLSLGEEGKAYGRKAKTSNRPGEIPPSGIIGGCVRKTRNRHAVRKMEVGPPKPSCRRRLQTAVSCGSQKLRW